jgi:phage FluMu protein Com
MAMREIGPELNQPITRKQDIRELCPRCNSAELIYIEGSFIRWIKCPKCKWTKLAEKGPKPMKVVPLR